MTEPTQETRPAIPQHSTRLVAIPVPEAGFDPADLEKYMTMGYRIWGVVPLATAPNRTDLVIPDHVQRPVLHLILDKEQFTVPLNLLAHHIIHAAKEKLGLEHLARFFFGLTLTGLKQARDDAERRFNERN